MGTHDPGREDRGSEQGECELSFIIRVTILFFTSSFSRLPLGHDTRKCVVQNASMARSLHRVHCGLERDMAVRKEHGYCWTCKAQRQERPTPYSIQWFALPRFFLPRRIMERISSFHPSTFSTGCGCCNLHRMPPSFSSCAGGCSKVASQGPGHSSRWTSSAHPRTRFERSADCTLRGLRVLRGSIQLHHCMLNSTGTVLGIAPSALRQFRTAF